MPATGNLRLHEATWLPPAVASRKNQTFLATSIGNLERQLERQLAFTRGNLVAGNRCPCKTPLMTINNAQHLFITARCMQQKHKCRLHYFMSISSQMKHACMDFPLCYLVQFRVFMLMLDCFVIMHRGCQF